MYIILKTICLDLKKNISVRNSTLMFESLQFYFADTGGNKFGELILHDLTPEKTRLFDSTEKIK